MEPANIWRESFIMRLQFQMPDESKSRERILRGQIVHTPTGKVWRFASLDDLTKIIDGYVTGKLNGDAIKPEAASE